MAFDEARSLTCHTHGLSFLGTVGFNAHATSFAPCHVSATHLIQPTGQPILAGSVGTVRFGQVVAQRGSFRRFTGTFPIGRAFGTLGTTRLPVSTGIARVTSSAGSVRPADRILYGSAHTSPFNLTLPRAGSFPGLVVMMKKIDATGNAFGASAKPGDLVEGTNTLRLTIPGESATLISDGGSRWGIV